MKGESSLFGLAGRHGATAREVAEALWLGHRLGRRSAVPVDHPAPPAPPEAQPKPATEAPKPGELPRQVRLVEADGVRTAGDRAPPTSGRTVAGALDRGAPVTNRLEMQRALRALAVEVRTGPEVVDLAATVQTSAEARRTVLRFGRAIERGTRLIVLEDQAGQMEPFRDAVRELVRLARETGRFRAVSHLRLDVADAARVLDPLPPRDAAPEAPSFVLVVTDGIGPGVTDGALGALLTRLGPARVALVHPWGWARGRSTPIGDLARTVPTLVPAEGGVASLGLPIVGLDGAGLRSLGPWAHGRREPALALRVRAVRRPGAPRRQPPPPDPMREMEQVAQDPVLGPLVALAAAVPGPVDAGLLRFLARHAGTEATDAHLAETLALGLLERAAPGSPLVVRLRDRDARRAALRWLPRPAVRPMLEALVEHLRERPESGRLGIQVDLLFQLLNEESPADPGGLNPELAEVLSEVLDLGRIRVPGWLRARLGVYAEVSLLDRIRPLLPHLPLPEALPSDPDAARSTLRAWLADHVRDGRVAPARGIEVAREVGLIPGYARELVHGDIDAGGTSLRPHLEELGLGWAFAEAHAEDHAPFLIRCAGWGDTATALLLAHHARTRAVVPVVHGAFRPDGLAARLNPLAPEPSLAELAAALIRAEPTGVPVVLIAADQEDPAVKDVATFLRGIGAVPRRAGATERSDAVVHDVRVELVRPVRRGRPPEPPKGTFRLWLGAPMEESPRWPAHAERLVRVAQSGVPAPPPTRFLQPPAPVPGQVLHTALHPKAPLDLAWIPPGTFQMGSPDGVGDADEHPRHAVRITRPFLAGVTPVTQAQWRAVAKAAGLPESPSRFKGDPHPVEMVSWFDAVRWCNALSAAEERPAAYTLGAGDPPEVKVDLAAPGYRLPTEAEWEYLCRAGTETRWSFGEDEAALGAHAWFGGNAGGTTHPVGEKRPNPWSLYDVHGNVWEWCGDAKRSYPKQPVDDPFLPPAVGDGRVIRGGSWFDSPDWCRSACRFLWHPGVRVLVRGFRVVLPPPRGP